MKKPFMAQKFIVSIFNLVFLILTTSFIVSRPATAVAEEMQPLQKPVTVQGFQGNVLQFIQLLEKKTGVSFVYTNQQLELNKAFTVDARNEQLQHLLKRVFTPLQLTYTVENKQIILKRIPVVIKIENKRGSVSGHITDSRTKESLAFATVEVVGTSLRAVSDISGAFYLANVLEGSVMLRVSYIGYTRLERQVEVIGGKNTQISLSLEANANQLRGIQITGIRRGEVKALSQMRTAENIKYVLSQEQIERYPDATVAEAMQRVPGLAVDYSYGLPRNVIIRGLDQSMGAVTMNGNRLPSTETNSRTVDLNGILSATVEAIEVNKTLTPDMDADGTAGTVNIITKTPVKGMKLLEAKGSYSRNNLLSDNGYEGAISYGTRGNRWGYLAGLNYNNSIRGEDRIQQEYDTYKINGVEKLLLSNLDLEGTELKRRNLGLQGELSYFNNNQSRIYLRGSYNKYYEVQRRGQRNYSIGEYTADNMVSDVSVGTSGSPRDYNRDLLTVSAGTKQIFNKWTIDGDLTYSKGLYDQPIYYDGYFTANDLSGALGFSNPLAPQFNFTDVDLNNPSSFTATSYNNRHQFAHDEDVQFSMNNQYAFSLLGKHKGIFKFGGRYRYKEDAHTRNYYQYKLINGAMNLSNFLSSYGRNDFYDNYYNLGNSIPNGYLLEDYYQANKNLFSVNETYNRQNTDPDSYEGKEQLGAAYVMSRLNLSKFEITAGVRYEYTGFNYKGNIVNFDNKGNYISTNRVKTNSSFDGFFPSVNLKYALSNQTNFRAAATRSLSRPSYYDLVPWEEIEPRRTRMKKGNPDLDQATSLNLDFLFEHYFRSVGLISGGVFYKEIDNYIYEGVYVQEGGQYDKWQITQSLNGAGAKVHGFELAWQQQFTFLPGPLNGLGIYANYTHIQSRFKVPGIESVRTVRLPDMRPKVGNFAISYEKYGFSGRLSLNFYDTFTKELAQTEANDELELARKQLDFSASQRINKHVKIFMGISNLNNAQVRVNYGDGRPGDYKYYSTWGNIGIKYSPF
ncbi:TonB-dependent receptor [Desertivirga brevis]|uniref:TonB-dependent receptor n=1 Tax=Desertivirga brevis TaxID=2810310 RepID=UPI001A96CDD9|nr:TonB-dependent receptor [Pedobacter sp. SYSU D00873]